MRKGCCDDCNCGCPLGYEAEAKIKALEASRYHTQLWKSKADKLAEAIRKIAKRWFDPEKEEYVCSNCDGGLHGFADDRPEYHDEDCCYEIAKAALSEYEDK